MKHLFWALIILVSLVWSCGAALAQDLNTIMWQEGLLTGRFATCFKDDSRVNGSWGKTYGTAYLRWYQVNNPHADLTIPRSMFINGMQAGIAEQRQLGTEGCDDVHQQISHIGQVIGVRIPDMSR
ncbi:hypothetical protein [Desulfovibrio cuneatus]|uniref:hypothetical protein n=1 Tax=Desulfovibrio cuneatus TaxID=159728 RepID=UPI000480795B|nr:hypothetical protein [Desulfovibrio cuneatus]